MRCKKVRAKRTKREMHGVRKREKAKKKRFEMRYHVPSRALPRAGCSILLWKFIGLCWHGWFDIFQCVGGRVAPGGILDYKNNINNGLSHCVYYKQSTVVVLFLPPGIEKPLPANRAKERTALWIYKSDDTWVMVPECYQQHFLIHPIGIRPSLFQHPSLHIYLVVVDKALCTHGSVRAWTWACVWECESWFRMRHGWLDCVRL